MGSIYIEWMNEWITQNPVLFPNTQFLTNEFQRSSKQKKRSTGKSPFLGRGWGEICIDGLLSLAMYQLFPLVFAWLNNYSNDFTCSVSCSQTMAGQLWLNGRRIVFCVYFWKKSIWYSLLGCICRLLLLSRFWNPILVLDYPLDGWSYYELFCSSPPDHTLL